MQAIMLLAGEGRRMRPLTYTKPKPLLKIANTTILEHNLEQLKKNDITDIVLVTGYLEEQVKEFTENFPDLKLTFSTQNERLGTGHALLQTKNLVDDKFLVMCGDDLYHHEDIGRIIKNDVCVTAKKVDNPKRFGVFVLENECVKDLIEKPDKAISNLANTGLYVLNKKIFGFLEELRPSKRNEFELTDAILDMSRKFPIKCELINNWIPIGYPWDLLTANEIKMNEMKSAIDETATIENNATITGNVDIGKNTVIKNGAYIEGPVIIGSDCVIGPNCYIRENSVIGDGSRIGNGSELKNSIIGSCTFVRHLSYVCDSVVGDNCNFGAGTITANLRHDNKTIRVSVEKELVDTKKRKLGVVMADFTKTGINTSTYPGVMMGPFTWTLPGSVVRENIRPLTLDGVKNLDESKFGSEYADMIKSVRALIK